MKQTKKERKHERKKNRKEEEKRKRKKETNKQANDEKKKKVGKKEMMEGRKEERNAFNVLLSSPLHTARATRCRPDICVDMGNLAVVPCRQPY